MGLVALPLSAHDGAGRDHASRRRGRLAQRRQVDPVRAVRLSGGVQEGSRAAVRASHHAPPVDGPGLEPSQRKAGAGGSTRRSSRPRRPSRRRTPSSRRSRTAGGETAVMVEQSADPTKGKFDLELVEAEAKTWDTFEASKNRRQHGHRGPVPRAEHDDRAARGQGGAWASEVMPTSRGASCAKTRGWRADTLYGQGLYWDALHNLGDGDLAPRPAWQVDPARRPGDEGRRDQQARPGARGNQDGRRSDRRPRRARERGPPHDHAGGRSRAPGRETGTGRRRWHDHGGRSVVAVAPIPTATSRTTKGGPRSRAGRKAAQGSGTAKMGASG